MSKVDDLIMRARRLAIFGQLIETYDDEKSRCGMIIGLNERGCLSDEAVEMLMDAYVFERQK